MGPFLFFYAADWGKLFFLFYFKPGVGCIVHRTCISFLFVLYVTSHIYSYQCVKKDFQIKDCPPYQHPRFMPTSFIHTDLELTLLR